ncbi:Glucosamine-6-phosphate deaminase [Roseimaritima multifibrata]|uniref:Glucosamine-6-phosphate deaminase n=1 Tax=Roseimaritima multifibrata TaxID=1930274 RepID=A0A517MF83_9BACT|nr:glucosamine-6-phosphate deaminase [Roseimaritima multifibrata]QDS93548.1 Glucosamine-6-phosphate deaminase [Roseimaritima multifibrata]
MRVVILEDSVVASRWAANFIAEQIRRKPTSVLGLATGGTPVRCYDQLIQFHKNDQLDFSQIQTFNLDEYLGLPPEDSNSYRRFMQENFFDHVNVVPARTHVPDGMAKDIDSHCQEYERRIKESGGIDLQLLGIGSDGHIAFNEPGSSLASRTRLKSLAMETVQDNARFFGSEEKVPRLAITMGVGTIMESRQCLLLATGANKATAVREAIEGPVTAKVTASALQMHPATIAVLDEAAAAELEYADYYREAEVLRLTLAS